MPFVACHFRSEVLGMGCSMNVILPRPSAARGPEAPTLWLLHGLSDDHSSWSRLTGIERYVSELGLAVVMPGVHRSFYADMASGGQYWTFLSEELPVFCRAMFRLSARREDNFVAGLSMGGYGALKWALNHPDRFAAAASLSGVTDPIARANASPERAREWKLIFGDPLGIAGTGCDLFHLAERLGASAHARLPLYQCCGDRDFLLDQNRRFRDHAGALKLNLQYHEHPGRDHDWGYWDQTIQDVLRWLPLAPRGETT